MLYQAGQRTGFGSNPRLGGMFDEAQAENHKIKKIRRAFHTDHEDQARTAAKAGKAQEPKEKGSGFTRRDRLCGRAIPALVASSHAGRVKGLDRSTLIPVMETKTFNMGYMNASGKIAIGATYIYAGEFQGDVAVVRTDKDGQQMEGLIDRNGKTVFPFIGADLQLCEDGTVRGFQGYVCERERADVRLFLFRRQTDPAVRLSIYLSLLRRQSLCAKGRRLACHRQDRKGNAPVNRCKARADRAHGRRACAVYHKGHRLSIQL